MSILFWTIAAIMIAVALGFVALPLWRSDRAFGGPTTEDADVAAYKQRRAELDDEREAGLLTEREYQQALTELDRQLLTDVEGDGPASSGKADGRWPLAVVGIAVCAIAIGMYLHVGGGRHALTGSAPSDPSQHDIEVMVQRLEDRLEDDPSDGRGWLMLGRSYRVMGKPSEAVKALSRARQILGDTPTVLVEYAQALASTRDNQSFSGRPAELIDRALEQAPSHPQALWLSGVVAAQRGDYETTVSRWEKLLTVQPDDGESTEIVRRNLEAARQRLASNTSAADPAAPARTNEADNASGTPSIEVRVVLADSLKDEAEAQETVFIFARAVDGPPMPLAVVKKRVGDLPVTVSLDDADSMMAGRGISGHERVELVARISKSGDAAAASGDLTSGARQVSVNEDQPVRMTIDSVVP